jgi:hypothetical protein
MRQIFGADDLPLSTTANAPLAGNLWQLVGDYTNPILKPQAAEVVKKHGEIALKGIGDATPNNQCWPEPMPYILSEIAIQMLQQPDKITILKSSRFLFTKPSGKLACFACPAARR